MNPPLNFFFLTVIANNNLLLKIYYERIVKYCGNISQFYFSSLFHFPSIFFFSLVFSPPHMYLYFSSLSSFLLFIFYLLVYLYLQMSRSFTWTKNTKTCHSSSHHIEGKLPLCSTKDEKNSLCPLSSISRYCGSDFS